MDINTVNRLIEAGFSADEIRQMTGMDRPAEQAPKIQPEETAPETPAAEESQTTGEPVDLYAQMMNEFRNTMNAQMKLFGEQIDEFRKTVQLSNVHQSIGEPAGTSVQDVIANIIRPSYKKGDTTK